jgi:hypothetical protein
MPSPFLIVKSVDLFRALQLRALKDTMTLLMGFEAKLLLVPTLTLLSR